MNRVCVLDGLLLCDWTDSHFECMKGFFQSEVWAKEVGHLDKFVSRWHESQIHI